ncbi:hypothetical protein [Streptomyces sp. DH24]|uniref:hypothetical protein n=1 Tax=Streptomyces sp. DH24 TaxID=3040123 RepID=UPI0024412E5A|nr:hypothetical protein [Streptomyces sp. DH24]MDG9716967.1 hypothetical protein [Streptomyces sp. DH24]
MAEPMGAARTGTDTAGSHAGTRLNQLPADQGGGGTAGPAGPPALGKDLASSPAEKKRAAKAIEENIEPDTQKAGRWADDDSAGAVKAFGPKDGDGWVTSKALKKAHETWGDQVKNLMDRLAAEKSALRSTSTLLQSTDVGVGSGVRQVSVLDRL